MIPTRKVDRSMWLRANFPANKSSKTKRQTICNYGINDADYLVNPTFEGMRVPCFAYATWRGMIQRSKDVDYKNKYKCYDYVDVCDDWQNFMAFRRWWLDNYKEGYELDKDLLSGSHKTYSPATCVFLPKWLNLFIKDKPNGSDSPKGVFFEENRGKFKATLKSDDITLNLGRFSSQQEAVAAVIDAKINIAFSRKTYIDSVGIGLFDIVISKIKEGF